MPKQSFLDEVLSAQTVNRAKQCSFSRARDTLSKSDQADLDSAVHGDSRRFKATAIAKVLSARSSIVVKDYTIARHRKRECLYCYGDAGE